MYPLAQTPPLTWASTHLRRPYRAHAHVKGGVKVHVADAVYDHVNVNVNVNVHANCGSGDAQNGS